MNAESFFSHYPFRKNDSDKFDNGVIAFLSGSYGMAGAAILNLIGARCTGASYIHSYLPASIYPVVAANEITTVYHPYDDTKEEIFDENSFRKVKAVALGSGINNLKYSENYLKQILSFVSVPVIIDAQGLRILSQNESFYSLSSKMILTPHLGEFSGLTGLSKEDILKDREGIAVSFAKEKGITLILKGPDTLIVSSEGKVTINNSGNAALAQAGSGDVLCGMVCGFCALYENTYQACVDAVWLHGHLADLYVQDHANHTLDLRDYPLLVESFFKHS